MPISGTSSDYTGRQIDLELLQSIAAPAGSQQMSLTTVSPEAKIVAGVEKVVQRYAMLFLTPLGDMTYDTSQGSAFIKQLLRGTIQDRSALQTYFATSNDAVLQQMKSDDAMVGTYGEQPLDEQIDTAYLLDFDIDFATATVMLRIELTTKAGTSVAFLLPATTVG